VPTYYVTRADLKTRLAIPSADTGSDAMLDSIIAGVCTQINDHCGRVFWTVSAMTRHYDAEFSDMLNVDDLTTITALATDSNGRRTYDETWSASDYELFPYNAAQLSWPYSMILVRPDGARLFPVGRRTVSVTGNWGWPAVPAPVIEAAFLQCERLYQRRNSPMGVAGPNEFGQLTALAPMDPDVIMLLRPYMRLSMRAV